VQLELPKSTCGQPGAPVQLTRNSDASIASKLSSIRNRLFMNCLHLSFHGFADILAGQRQEVEREKLLTLPR